MRPLFVLFCSLLLISTVSAEQRPVTPRDLFDLRTISGVEVSPDGSAVLFAVSTQSVERNRTETSWLRLPSGGGEPTAVLGLPSSAGNVRWSPDGSRLAYTSDKSLYVLDLATGQSHRVCDYEHSNAYLARAGNMLAWSPDGGFLAFAGSAEAPPAAQDPIVVTRIQYKGRTALSDNRRTHVFVVPASGGAPRVLTPGNFDEHSISWTAGDEIIFLSNREADPDANLNYDLYAVHPQTGAIRQITRTPGVEMEPELSPDGKWIAYTATKRSLTTIDSVAEDAHLWVIPAAGGEARELNSALDRRTGAPFWSADGRTLYFQASDHGRGLIYRTPARGGDSVPLFTADAAASQASAARDGSFYFVMSDPLHPGELYRLPPGASKAVRLTRLNDGLLKNWQLSRPEPVSLASFDGTRVEGWFYPAIGRAAKSPLILTIHGGPHGAFDWSFQGSAQTYAARGYAVLALNPRGSNGYGQKFSDGCVGDWGGGDYRDLMGGLDFVLKSHPEIDPRRLGVTGASYGGFMTNWVITQTDRFRAAVATASLSNLISFYATSLYQDLVHAEFGGFPWEGDHFQTLWKWSPLAYAQKVKTPTLFLHGEADNDVHITQAEEMYTALRRRGVESALVRYPREAHSPTEPKHKLDMSERLLSWMDRFLAKAD